ncbi:YjhX family toxin [Hyphomonas sp.]|uniref:YjhX family toxin n=1 Tax=Hyphomonas sp. TaxID=87 RepID=UPI00391CF82A
MDISREEQRVLHLLAQGGWIEARRSDGAKIDEVSCFNREGWRYGGLSLELFRKLKRRGTIASSARKPYRITRRGLRLVRSQPDNC